MNGFALSCQSLHLLLAGYFLPEEISLVFSTLYNDFYEQLTLDSCKLHVLGAFSTIFL